MDLPESISVKLEELKQEEIDILLAMAADEYISGDVQAFLDLKLSVDFKQVHKEALQYLKGYKTQLVKRGGSTCTVPVLDDAGNITGYKQKFIPWMKEYHEGQRRQLATAIQDMVKEGKSVKKAAKDVEDIFNKYKGHAEATIQTESRKANTAGSLNRYKKNGVGKWEWSTAGSDVCPYCQELQGQVFDEGDSNQPRPPLHSRCRCRSLPVFDMESEIASFDSDEELEEQ